MTNEEASLFEEQYQIEETIGTGRHCVVVKAKDKLLHRSVAIKMLRDQAICTNLYIRKCFLKEAKILNSIDHPNVVRVFRTGLTSSDTPYFVMEYLKGRTLNKYIQENKPVNFGTFLKIAQAIAFGIEHIHSKEIIHHDLKPENIIVNEQEPQLSKIVDFDIARSSEMGDSQTRQTQAVIRGTASYMSPERAQGLKGDLRGDIYSFSCILFEMLTGKTPFEANSKAELLLQHVHAAIPGLEIKGERTGKSKLIEAKVNELIKRGLQKSPEDRFESFAELSQELADLEKQIKSLTDAQVSELRFEVSKAKAADKRWTISPKRLALGVLLSIPLLGGLSFLAAHEMTAFQDTMMLQRTAQQEAAQQYFQKRFKGLLDSAKYSEAKMLVLKTTDRISNSNWSKTDRKNLIFSFLDVLSKESKRSPETEKLQYELSILALDATFEYCNDFRHRGTDVKFDKQSKKDIADLSQYLLDNSKDQASWQRVAEMFAKHKHSFPVAGDGAFLKPEILRVKAEVACPHKAGEDSDIFSVHCSDVLRIAMAKARIDKNVDNLIAAEREFIPYLKERGQLKDHIVILGELGCSFMECGRKDLAKIKLAKCLELGEEFGLGFDERNTLITLNSELGMDDLRLGQKSNAKKNLDAINEHLVRLGQWEAYQKLFAVRNSKDPSGTYTPEQLAIIQAQRGSTAFSPAYQLQLAFDKNKSLK